MAKKKLSNIPPQQPIVVSNLPAPPPAKTKDYLGEFKGWVFPTVSLIAEEVATIELHLYKKKIIGGEVHTTEILEHEALSLIHSVNNFSTRETLFRLTQIYIDLTGEAFWALVRDGNTPSEIWMLRPDWVKVIPSAKDFISHYEYSPWGNYGDKVTLEKNDVIQFKSPNPLNPYRGRGVVQSTASALDVFNFSQEYQRAFFYNSALPSVIFSTDSKINQKEIRRWMAAWEQRHKGAQSAHRVGVLSGGNWKVDAISPTMKDMDFIGLNKWTRDQILAAFRVSKANLGITEDVNRATQEATDLRFSKLVIKPRMKSLVEHLNEFLLPLYPDSENLFFDFDDPVGVDMDQELKLYESGSKYSWLTPNEIRERQNLPPLEGGDEVISFGSFPQDGVKETIRGFFKRKGKMALVNKENFKRKHNVQLPHKSLASFKKDQDYDKIKKSVMPELIKVASQIMAVKDRPSDDKLKVWDNLIESTNVWESQLERIVNQLLAEQEKVVQEKVSIGKFLKKRPSVTKNNVDDWLEVLDEKENERWGRVILPFLLMIIAARGKTVLGELAVQVTDLDLEAHDIANYINDESLKFISSVNETTRNALKGALIEGIKQGEGANKLRGRIQEVYIGVSKNRAAMIARTEVMRAANQATLAAYKQSGVVEGKEWLVAKDERTCEFCLQMEKSFSQVGLDDNFIPKDTDLEGTEGGILKLDYGNLDAPPLHPRCRCTIVPIFNFNKTHKILDREKLKLEKTLGKLERGIKEKEQYLKEILPIHERELMERARQKAEEEKERILAELKAIRDEVEEVLNE